MPLNRDERVERLTMQKANTNKYIDNWCLQRPDETHEEWKIRLIVAKKNGELNGTKFPLKWSQIVNLLGESVSSDHFRKYASGVYDYYNYKNQDNVSTRVLSISDLHFPYCKPLSTFEKYIGRVDILQLNGDLVDCAQLSKFTNKSKCVSITKELIRARQYLIDLIHLLNPKKVIANNGNHDLRIGDYIAKKTNSELCDIMPSSVLDYIFTDGFIDYDNEIGTKTEYSPLTHVFKDSNIEIKFTGKWYSQFGDTVFCHPRAYSSVMLKTAEKALYYFRNEGFDFRNIVMAHTHRQGYYVIGNSAIYEQGACCETRKMKYSEGRLVNSQKEGFVYMCFDEHGHAIREKTKLMSLN